MHAFRSGERRGGAGGRIVNVCNTAAAAAAALEGNGMSVQKNLEANGAPDGYEFRLGSRSWARSVSSQLYRPLPLSACLDVGSQRALLTHWPEREEFCLHVF